MILIGEKINASLALAKRIISERDHAALLDLASRQAAAGADYLDVNVGTGQGSAADEAASMRWAVEAIQETLDTPLCIDSADPTVLEEGLAARQGRPSLINSTKSEDKALEVIVPLAAKFEAPLVGLAMDEAGIPKTAEDRLTAARRIVEACEKHGVPPENLFLDPLVLPVSTDVKQGLVTLETLARVKAEFPGVRTTMGLSNVSFGLPGRARVNAAFMHMAIFAGLDGAIVDPLDEAMMGAVRTAEMLVGRDRHCRRYTRFFRKK
jgi:5-methyltetrahydrofolate--homocysteine methyltransferase